MTCAAEQILDPILFLAEQILDPILFLLRVAKGLVRQQQVNVGVKGLKIR